MTNENLKKFYLKDYFDNVIIYNDTNYINHWGLININLPNSLTYAENEYFFNLALNNENISTVIISDLLYKLLDKKPNKNLIIAENPKVEFWKFHNFIAKKLKSEFKKISKSAFIHPTVFIGNNVIIGENVKIEPNVTILDNVIIKNNVHIHSGSVIGSSGLQTFEYNNKLELVEHVGGVIIHDNVKILSGVNISKGIFPYEFTEVGKNSVISIQSSIGHCSKIGKNCMIAGNSLISGSVNIEDDVWIGPSVSIKNGIKIGKKSKILIGSVIIENVEEGEVVSGNFAYNHIKRIKNYLKEKLK